MPRPRAVRNEDYTDRELLTVIDQQADNDGMANINDIARALGFTSSKNGASPARKVSTRLAWMKRYGMLERKVKGEESFWYLTPIGVKLMKGQLSKPVERSIERMDPGTQLLMMRTLSVRGYINADPVTAVAMRREFAHQLARRPRK